MYAQLDRRKRWWALIVLCVGVLMIVLDTSIVVVALPSIRGDLGFAAGSLAWVVNAYALTFGCTLLLGGRLGDLYGHRRLFLIGVAVFTLASLASGLATSQALLISARAVQGLGAAAVMTVALCLVTAIFPDGTERARALGICGFICGGGASIGPFLGGAITSALGWQWVFFVNLPIGVAIFAICRTLLPDVRATEPRQRLDVWGAVTLTASLVLTSYAIGNGNEAGWTSTETLALFTAAVASLALFLVTEARVSAPLVPLGIFRFHNLAILSVARVLWNAGMSPWRFMCALYLQLVLGFESIEVGLAFLPSSIVMAASSLGLSARLVARWGLRGSIVVGMILSAIGLTLLARAPVSGSLLTDVIPATLLLGVGAGIGLNPLFLAGMKDVTTNESGLVAGIGSTASTMGGALGLAVLVAVSSARASDFIAAGGAAPAALTSGYRAAFLLGAILTGIAAVLTALFLHTKATIRLRSPMLCRDPTTDPRSSNGE